MKFRVYVSFKKGILDPEAEAIKQTIKNMGTNSIQNLIKGKFFDITFKLLFSYAFIPIKFKQ